MTDGPMEPLAKLAKAAKAVAGPLGFNLRMFLAEPSIDGGPHRARIVYDVDTDKLGEGTPADSDAALEAMWKATEEAEAERLRDQTRENLSALEKTLRDPTKGILDD